MPATVLNWKKKKNKKIKYNIICHLFSSYLKIKPDDYTIKLTKGKRGHDLFGQQ